MGGITMNYILELQLSELKEKETEIKHGVRELIQDIFKHCLSRENVIINRDILFATIDYVKVRYTELFTFDIHYNENHRLDTIKSDIRKMIEKEYRLVDDEEENATN
jgi:hypothetical protein